MTGTNTKSSSTVPRHIKMIAGLLIGLMIGLVPIVEPEVVQASEGFERVGAITLDSGENSLASAVIDPVGSFAYFGTYTAPARVVKVDLDTFTRVDAITFESDENGMSTAVIAPDGQFAYFATADVPGTVVKVDLTTFERVGSLTLEEDESVIVAALVDPSGEFLYLATSDRIASVSRLVKIDLATFQRVDHLDFGNDDDFSSGALIDPVGRFAYLGTLGPGAAKPSVVKVDLDTFTRVGAIQPSQGVDGSAFFTAVMDPAGEYGYFSTFCACSADESSSVVVRVDLAAFAAVDAVTLLQSVPFSAVMDPGGAFAYFAGLLGEVTKIDLATFAPVDTITLDTGEFPQSGVMHPTGGAAYFGTAQSPGRVVELSTPAPPPSADPDLRLRAIEVNQAVQSWTNDVSLYLGKPTVVRVFLEQIDDTSPGEATGLLHARRVDGQPLAGSPITPSNGPLVVPEDAAKPDDVTTVADESVRGDLDGSLNFVLPPEWTRFAEGMDLSFELTSPGAAVECAEPDGSPDCTVRIGWATPTRPEIGFSFVPYVSAEQQRLDVNATSGTYQLNFEGHETTDIAFDADAEDIREALLGLPGLRRGNTHVIGDGPRYRIVINRGSDEPLLSVVPSSAASVVELRRGGQLVTPSRAQMDEQRARMQAVMPTDWISFSYIDVNSFNRQPELSEVNSRLAKKRLVERITHARRTTDSLVLYGFLGEGGGVAEVFGAGMASGRAPVASAYELGAGSPSAQDVYFRMTGAHEIAHAYEIPHAGYTTTTEGDRKGICDSAVPKETDYFPYTWFEEIPGLVNSRAIDGVATEIWPTIGPLSEGPDDEIWGLDTRFATSGPSSLAVANPYRVFELTSYCNSALDSVRWISDITYLRLRAALQGGIVATGADTGDDGEFLVVTGSENHDTGLLELDPLTTAVGAAPEQDSGDLHVALVANDGSELSAVDVALGHGEGEFPGQAENTFAAAVPVPPGAQLAALVITHEGTELARVDASLTAPEISLISPSNGSTVTGATLPVAWTATDADGDPLTAAIHLSLDDGQTWEVLALDVGGNGYAAPTAYLAGSTTARVRVVLSDGLHSTTATSDTFGLEGGGPVVTIEEPVGPAVEVADGAPLRLSATVWTPTIGRLEDPSITWTSSLDGVLATGSPADLSVGSLSDGCHTVTATYLGIDGRAGDDMTSLAVGDVICNAPPVPGSLIVERATTPPGGATAQFTSSLAGYGTFALPDGAQLVVTDVAPGQHSLTTTDPGSGLQLQTVECDDPDGGTTVSSAGEVDLDMDAGETILCRFVHGEVADENQPPLSDTGGPYLGAVDTLIALDGTASSDPDGDPLTYQWTVDGGSFDDSASPTPGFTAADAGIYPISLEVCDPSGSCDSAEASVVVYDPSGGFVTGGGWIDSLPGACGPAAPEGICEGGATGRASFGFVAKYKKGATVPDGQTEFIFQAGNLTFHSHSYDWLIVSGWNRAQFKGTGSVNDIDEYQFMITAYDGGATSPDGFRIKIWNEVGIAYDNKAGEDDSLNEANTQEIAGGNVVIHAK